jgi:hypothetical protein
MYAYMQGLIPIFCSKWVDTGISPVKDNARDVDHISSKQLRNIRTQGMSVNECIVEIKN